MLTGPRGFDRGIERQQIGLVSDRVDDADFSAMVFIAATVSFTARPPSEASLLALPAMPSVTLAFSVFWAMDADICSIDAEVCSTEAACSEADWLMLWAVAEISSEALDSESAEPRTSPMISESFSTVPLTEVLSSRNLPW